jgi:type IV pilus assembly protein PilQ
MNMNKPVRFAPLLAAVIGVFVVPAPAQAAMHSQAPYLPAPRTATTTIHFDKIPVRSALQLIAEEGRFNLVVPDSVTGTISLHLRNVTWEEALDVVLRLKGLRQRVEGDAVTVTRG